MMAEPDPHRPVRRGGSTSCLAGLGPALAEAAIRAAKAALRIRAEGSLDVRTKADHSPVSAGDLAADDEICRVLSTAFPGIPIVSEESGPPLLDPDEAYFLVDPIDGTREYISGGREFTVNIAFLRNRTPEAGIVLAPAMRKGFLAAGCGATEIVRWPDFPRDYALHPLSNAPVESTRSTAAVSRRHLDRATRSWLAKHEYDRQLRCGSSWKFGLLAERAAAVYPRLSPMHGWDIAAGHAILVSAGGRVMTTDGLRPLRYASGASEIPGFVAYAPCG